MLPVATNSLALALGLPFNGCTGNDYTGGNIPLLLGAADANGFESNVWAGFTQWLKVGRVVSKGQKATGIMMVVDFDQKDAEGAPKTREDGSKIKGRSARTVPVFNFEQTEVIDAEKAQQILDAKAARAASKPAKSGKRGKR